MRQQLGLEEGQSALFSHIATSNSVPHEVGTRVAHAPQVEPRKNHPAQAGGGGVKVRRVAACSVAPQVPPLHSAGPAHDEAAPLQAAAVSLVPLTGLVSDPGSVRQSPDPWFFRAFPLICDHCWLPPPEH